MASLPIPDVGRAIMLNQVNPEVDRQKRMAGLELQRKETYAIRDLWRSMLRHKARRQNFPQPNKGLSECRLREVRDLLQREQLGYHERRPGLRRLTASMDNTNSDNNCFSFKKRHDFLPAGRHSESAPVLRQRQSNDEQIPYHTAITMPPVRSKSTLGFNALNRKLVCNLPNIYDTGYRPPGYAVRDVKEWKNEVKKIVPRRPEIFLPAHAQTRSMSVIMPPPLAQPEDTSCMFRCTINRAAGKDKEYMINPEWASEKCIMDTNRPRAERVYGWNA